MREATIDRVEVSAYRIPTDFPEADGTLAWDSTTMVLVRAYAGGKDGLGYTYSDAAAATLIDGKLKTVIEGRDVMDLPGA